MARQKYPGAHSLARQKVKPYFLCGFAAFCSRKTSLRPCAGSVSKKGQAKPALFWSKGKTQPTTRQNDPVGAHCVRPQTIPPRNGQRAHAVRPYENPKVALVLRWG
jgi:hypothetical protein